MNIKLTKQYKEEFIEMIEEWKKDIKENNTNQSPSIIFKTPYDDFDNYIDKIEVKENREQKVKSSTFFAFDFERNKIVGAVNIRHELNDELLKSGGHIGDGVRPGERRKGYATKMISLALEECKKLGIEKVLITCDRNNIGSAKSIQNNGGKLENEVEFEGKIMQRYWIDLKK